MVLMLIGILTILYIACDEGHTGTIALLLYHNDIDVNKCDGYGEDNDTII